MADVIVTKVEDRGNDVLRVEGTVDGEPTVGVGWVSAMTNHYGIEHQDAEGNRLDGAQPREMTDGEKMVYWQGLLAPAEATPTTPTVLYEGT